MLEKILISGVLAAGPLLLTAQWQLEGSDEWNTAHSDAADTELRFTGSGNGSSRAETRVPAFRPGSWYELSFQMQGQMKYRGWPIGAPCAEVPFRKLEIWECPTGWRDFRYRLQAPAQLPDGANWLAFGQSNHTGDVRFRNAALSEVRRIPAEIGGVPLFGHEAVYGNRFYANESPITLGYRDELQAGESLELVYTLPEREFRNGTWRFNGVNLKLEASKDGKEYVVVADHAAGGAAGQLPASVMGAERLHLKVTPLNPARKGVFSFSRIEADFSGAPLTGAGRTLYCEVPQKTEPVTVELETVALDPVSGNYDFTATARNVSGSAATFVPQLNDNGIRRASGDSLELAPGAEARFTLRAALPESGERLLRLGSAADGISMRLFIPILYDAAYGRKLAATADGLTAWSADAGYRVGRDRVVPTAQTEALLLTMARNEAESVQLVLRSDRNIAALPLSVSALTSDSGAVLPASAVDLRRVDYLFLAAPTDEVGVTDFWPDPLTPLTTPLQLEAGHNQPVMVTVTAPPDAAPGIYRGDITVGDALRLPIEIQLFDFTLPDTLSCTAVSDLGTRYLEESHKAVTDADKRAVFERYLAAMGAHHIAPYNPTPYDQPRITWPEADGEVAIDFTDYERELKRVLDTYHFKRFTVQLPLPPGIERLDADMTTEQEAAFASAIAQYQDFYAKNGLLDIAFVYVWDEPHPSAFPQVDRCLERLRKYAPKLKRMVTPFWVEERWGTNLDIWAFLSHHYVEWAAQGCRDRGEELWWYVCTGPRAPYATGFIDHPASELRTWLWQTRQYRMEGTLYWSSVFWSNATLPGYPVRNLYTEPMLTNESGGEFGNGDGMLLYPPRDGFHAAAAGPILEDAVTSQRLVSWRDGLEDFEYFRLLEEKLHNSGGRLSAAERAEAEALLTVPEAVSRSLDDFSPKPEAMKAHRNKLAKMIEKLK